MITMKVAGKTALERRLRRLPKSAGKHVGKAAMAGAEELADKARQFAPRKSGKLARSIEAKPGSDHLRAEVVVGEHYGRFVEGGTRPHNLGKGQHLRKGKQRGARGSKAGRRHPGARPRPFLNVAFRLLKKRIRGRITRAIRKAIKESGR